MYANFRLSPRSIVSGDHDELSTAGGATGEVGGSKRGRAKPVFGFIFSATRVGSMADAKNIGDRISEVLTR